jgi:NAD+ synthase (glutamine-hydrolysing)
MRIKRNIRVKVGKPKTHKLKIAVSQMNPVMGDIAGNKDIMNIDIRKAINARAKIIVFPEMAISGYPSEDLLYKHGFVEECILALAILAKKFSRQITMIVGTPFRNETMGALYNCACVLNNGKMYFVSKEALPNYGVFDEKRYFEPGDFSLPSVFQLDKNTSIGVTICEDMWVKDGPTARQARQELSMLINISASPYHMNKTHQRFLLALEHHHLAQQVPFVYCNLVGGQDELVFDGSSFVIRHDSVIEHMHSFETDLRIFDLTVPDSDITNSGIPHHELKATRTSSYLWRQRPVDTRSYSGIAEIHEALVLGTRDYAEKNGFTDVVVGLSGGIDSAVVATLAKMAGLKVHGVTMPSIFNSQETMDDAGILATNLAIDFMKIPIEQVHESYDRAFSYARPILRMTGVTDENIQARIRGNILMALSNQYGWLVLTTGNKSEVAVGYCTLYGDTAGGFAPLKDVPKTMVYQLARHMNLKGNYIPETTITRAPSAELKPDQKDQDSLPPYEVLDEIIHWYMEENQSVKEIAKLMSIKAATVTRIVGLIDRAEYKRRQAAPGVKITPRAFGRDWRLPIVNKWRSK